MADKALTFGTISLAVSIIGGWIWATTFFMTRADADEAHLSFARSIRIQYLELKIDQHNTELAFIEQAGIATVEQRQYDLLKFSVERMTQQLLEMDK